MYVSILRYPLTYTYPSIVGDLRTSTSIFIAFNLIVPHTQAEWRHVTHTIDLSYPHPYTIKHAIGTSYPHIDSLFNNLANCKENGDTGRPGSGLRGVQDDAGGRTGHPGGEHLELSFFCSSVTDEETNVRLRLHVCACGPSRSRSTRRVSPWTQKKMEERN